MYIKRKSVQKSVRLNLVLLKLTLKQTKITGFLKEVQCEWQKYKTPSNKLHLNAFGQGSWML